MPDSVGHPAQVGGGLLPCGCLFLGGCLLLARTIRLLTWCRTLYRTASDSEGSIGRSALFRQRLRR